jgi:hypothetical protein
MWSSSSSGVANANNNKQCSPEGTAAEDPSVKCCPKDSRMLTDYRSKCYKIFEGAPRPMSTAEYRTYLVEHADSIMESNRARAEEVTNPCAWNAGENASDATTVDGFDGLFMSWPESVSN